MRATVDRGVRVNVRWLIRRDLPAVLAIERAGFEHAWTEDDFLRVLRQRNCIGMAAEHNDRIIGFMVYELHKARLHVLNFAVAPACRRAGVGSQLVARLAHKLASHRRGRLTLAVRESNLPAQLFFRAVGFRADAVLRGYYADSGEDAYWMVRRAPEPAWAAELGGEG